MNSFARVDVFSRMWDNSIPRPARLIMHTPNAIFFKKNASL